MKTTSLSTSSMKSPSYATPAQTMFGKYQRRLLTSRSFGFLFLLAILAVNGNPLLAQSFNYQGDAASIGSGCHALTLNQINRRGAMWEQSKIDMTEDFEIKFSALFGDTDAGGDGIALVLQNSSSTPLGGTGAAMGFATNAPNNAIPQSLAIEFDTNDDGSSRGDGGSGNDHIAIVSNGNQASPLVPIVNAHVAGQNIEDNAYHYIVVAWNATSQTLRVYFDGMLRTTVTQDFVTNIFANDPDVYWGFTSATGANTNSHVICDPSVCTGSPEFRSSIGRLISGVPDDGEEAFSVKPANDCGYIAVGQTSLPPTTYGNMMAVKTDNEGNADWVKTYSFGFGTSIDKGVLTDIEALGDGYIATGWTRFYVRSLIILRLENDGSVRWASVQGGSHFWEDGYDIEPTPDGGFVVVGHTQDRVFMIHLDKNGVQNWTKSYGLEDQIWKAYSVEPTDDDADGLKDDGFAICGSKKYANDPTSDLEWFVIKTDHLGNLKNTSTMGGTGDDEAFTIKQVDTDNDGILNKDEFVVGGYISNTGGRKLATFIQYTATTASNQVDAVSFDDGFNHSVINALEQDINGNIVCAGSLDESSGGLLKDAFIANSAIDGTHQWSEVYGSASSNDWFSSLESVHGLGYILTGNTESFGSGDGDFFIVKTNEFGSGACNSLDRDFAPSPVPMYSYPDEPDSDDFGDLSSMLVFPTTETPDVDNCPSIMKKSSDPTSIVKTETGTYSVYPNPVSNGSSLQITMDENLTGSAEIVLTDITGKTQLLKQYTLTQGTTELSLPINNLSPGIYHLSVRTTQGTSVYKVLIE